MKGFSEIDFNHGIQKERAILPIIKRFFDRNIELVDNQYSKFDFKDDKGNFYDHQEHFS